METKCKTLPARRAGKSKKLPARVKICLPDLADKCWYIFWISKIYINITITAVSAVGASKILRSLFLKAQSSYVHIKSYLPGRAGKSEKLPARAKICLPRAGGQAVVSNAGTYAQKIQYRESVWFGLAASLQLSQIRHCHIFMTSFSWLSVASQQL